MQAFQLWLSDFDLGLPPIVLSLLLGVWGATSLLAVLISFWPSRGMTALLLPSFVTGWFVSEAPAAHLLVMWTVGALLVFAGALSDEVGFWGLGACVLASVGLVFHLVNALRVPALAEAALRRAFGDDFASRLPADFDFQAAFPPLRLYFFLLLYDRRVRVIRNLPYLEGGSRRQMLDVYLPKEPVEDAPVIFQIHGGAWVTGYKAQQARPLLYMLAARGYVCVSINYRLSPWHRWPAHLLDAKRALAWTKQHIASYGGDPSRVLVTGGSAGGQLAALLALTPNRPELQPGFEEVDTCVQAAVPFYGVYDALDRHGLKPWRAFPIFFSRVVARRPIAANEELFDLASPLVQVGPDAPPMFVVHGTHDSLAPVEEARLFAERLRAVSPRPVAYLELPYVHHMFETFYSLRALYVLRAVYAFAELTVGASGPGASAKAHGGDSDLAGLPVPAGDPNA